MSKKHELIIEIKKLEKQVERKKIVKESFSKEQSKIEELKKQLKSLDPDGGEGQGGI